MSSISFSIRSAAASLSPMLQHEPGVRPNFQGADHVTTAAIMAVVIGRGINTAAGIFTYLDGRQSKFDRPTVQFLLDVFDGRDRRQSLWTKDAAGRYRLLTSL